MNRFLTPLTNAIIERRPSAIGPLQARPCMRAAAPAALPLRQGQH
jgi:hypothetical protein